MSIAINHVRKNDSDKTVFFTIIVSGEKDPVKWHADTPVDQEPQVYLESIKDKITLLIFNRLYPENDHRRFMTDDITELEAMKLWISKGHKNLIDKKGKKNIYEVIEKQPWRSTHPPNLALKTEIDKATITPELKEILKKVIIA